jgi:G:T-mismatch repair DNA endonuclease (very short patch repair protein)
MTSQVFQIAQNVKEARQQMKALAALGWAAVTIAPNGKIASKHRTLAAAEARLNDYMRAEGCKVWPTCVSA